MIPAPDKTTAIGSRWWKLQDTERAVVELYWHGETRGWHLCIRSGWHCVASITFDLGDTAPGWLLAMAYHRQQRRASR